jgi:proteic killer suppression protein
LRNQPLAQGRAHASDGVKALLRCGAQGFVEGYAAEPILELAKLGCEVLSHSLALLKVNSRIKNLSLLCCLQLRHYTWCLKINILFIIRASMIESFANDETEKLFATGKSRRLPPDILKRALMRLVQLHAAVEIDDLRMPPSNRLEALTGDLQGKWSIRINDRWRLCFRFERGHAYEVEILDYH